MVDVVRRYIPWMLIFVLFSAGRCRIVTEQKNLASPSSLTPWLHSGRKIRKDVTVHLTVHCVPLWKPLDKRDTLHLLKPPAFQQKELSEISLGQDCHDVSTALIAFSSPEFDDETRTRHQ